jgi:hypothetical protein
MIRISIGFSNTGKQNKTNVNIPTIESCVWCTALLIALVKSPQYTLRIKIENGKNGMYRADAKRPGVAPAFSGL